MSFEESLVRHAAPTLANIKIANLYRFKFESVDECQGTVEYFNSIMNPKGIYIELLEYAKESYLVYVYRKSRLQVVLCDNDVERFLSELGYSTDSGLQGYLGVLKDKLHTEAEFPHEMGVFLGYPLPDVKAFIEDQRDGYVLCGDWKVYHDEDTAKCLFCKYKHCREVFVKVYNEGRKFGDMLVSA